MSLSLERKCEVAFAALVSAIEDLGMTVYTGADSDQTVRPCVVCWCRGGQEDPMCIGTGNMRYRVTIIVKTQSQQESSVDGSPVETEVTHAEAVQRVFEGINVDDLAAQLSAAVDGFAVMLALNAGTSPDIETFSFESAQDYSLLCCGVSIT